ncbi:hypothetical protein L6164_014886 [Bauhinia variegata]|uniref:Uncharacterized protein n=1 Tax=Bauhinia variegata TaxID=167791 RepID=A0ACB9NKT7_BAUVA|nr:hypothetical protein L6164_014886 [Bauhinia variegata]
MDEVNTRDGGISELRNVFDDKNGIISSTELHKGVESFEIGGAPHGVRVVSTPNSSKPISVCGNPRGTAGFAIGSSTTCKLPPLASFSDVYGDLMRQKGLTCGVCSDKCVSGIQNGDVAKHSRPSKGHFIFQLFTDEAG